MSNSRPIDHLHPTTMPLQKTASPVDRHWLASAWLACTLSLPLAAMGVDAPPPVNDPTPAPKVTHKAKATPARVDPPPEAISHPVEMAPNVRLTAGKSTLIRLPDPAVRLAIGNPEVADVMLINAREVYLLGKKAGTTNLLVWTASGRSSLRDVAVGADVDKLQGKLQELLPTAAGVKIDSLGDTLVISGRVTDGAKVARIVTLAEAFLGGAKVVNLMQVEGAQQVMLEVKVAEVSRSLMEELGVEFDVTRTISNTTVGVLSKLLSAGASTISVVRPNGRTNVTLSAEMKKNLVKILAEPTITAINGQEGSFLAGGKIFIPVPQGGAGGSTTITLEEKEFGVGLRFLPTVLEDGLINLRVTPEVSELSQLGATVSGAGGQTSVLPSITTRRASTTVQLHDGESFAIGGLIKSNTTETIRAMPLLGELPILGALFRSSAFQSEQSELLFIVTPRLAKALPASPPLPTDAYKQPTRAEFFLEGKLEQGPKPPLSNPGSNPATSQPAAPESTTTDADGQP